MKAKWSAKKTESSVTSSEFGDAFKLSGRRVVELEVLAEALDEGWKVCNTLLQLSSCTDETLSGLGSFLYIACSNSECGEINVCHTNKTHRVAGTTRGTKMNSTVEAIEINIEASLKPLQESNRELKNKLEHLERYS